MPLLCMNFLILVPVTLLMQIIRVKGSPTPPPPDHFNVGMMFPIAEASTWRKHEGGALAEAAMLMAFDEINDKTDGIADDLLPGVALRVVVRSPLASFTKGVDSAEDMLGVNGGEGVLINIGPYSFSSTQGNNVSLY